jgi:hypothetical protein
MVDSDRIQSVDLPTESRIAVNAIDLPSGEITDESPNVVCAGAGTAKRMTSAGFSWRP